MDRDGNLFIADRNSARVRRVAAGADGKVTGALDEIITTVAGTAGFVSAANAGLRQDAANKLQSFINAVEAQRGKELTGAQADELVAFANRIVSVI